MTADAKKRDTEGREIGWVERPFAAASSYRDDAAKGGSMSEEGEEIGDEAQARVVVQCGQ